MHLFKSVAVALGIGLLPAFATAGRPANGPYPWFDPTSIKWSPKVGAHHYYKVSMKLQAPGEADAGDLVISAELKDTVHEISDAGEVTMDRRWSKFAATVKGEDAGGGQQPKDSTIRVTFAPNGDIVDQQPLDDDGKPIPPKKGKSEDDEDEPANYGLPVPPVIYPSRPVDVGAKWQDEAPGADKKGKKDSDPTIADIFFTFAGEETADSVDCYRIDVDTTPDKKAAYTAYGHIWVSKVDGSLVELRLKLKELKSDAENPKVEMELTADLDD